VHCLRVVGLADSVSTEGYTTTTCMCVCVCVCVYVCVWVWVSCCLFQGSFGPQLASSIRKVLKVPLGELCMEHLR
jgi:hypothetical protein